MIARRPTRLTTISSLPGAAFCVALAVALVVSSAPARADEDEPGFESKILRGIMEGLGLRKDGEAINYQERAPLVIPPSRALPPPEKSGAVIANNPAWPKDPDVLRQKEAAAMERKVIWGAEAQTLHDQSVLRPDQMTPGPKPRNARKSSGPDGTQATTWGYGERLSPSQLGYQGGIFKKMFGGRDDEVAKFTGEPPRASLTEPPPGYQTPSPDQPYGLGPGAATPKVRNDFIERGEVKN